jgi:hypothetical protein
MSVKIGRLELLPCAMADMEDVHFLLPLYDEIDHAVDIGPVAVKQVSEALVFRCCRATVRA